MNSHLFLFRNCCYRIPYSVPESNTDLVLRVDA